MSNNYKTKYNTRVLYSQKYATEDEVTVSSTTYAVMWSFNKDSDPITSRIRITLLYKKDGTMLSPIQGLIEQWKGEGWTPMDEFADAELVFESSKEFEDHMLRMARSFILGVPLNADVDDFDDTPEDPVNTRTFDTKVKRFKKGTKLNNIKPIKVSLIDPIDEIEATKSTNDNAPDNDSSDDDDDDEWL